MPTYYNGQEIKESSIISGRSLTGRGTINIGGRTITPTPTAPPPPPPQLVPVRLVDGGRIPDRMAACSIGLGGTPLDLYCANAPGVGEFLFNDDLGSSPFNGGDAWYYELSNVVHLVNTGGEILDSFRCGR
jgi:hypothetical protein